jgi:uncharacterized protein with PQ loop repeat
MTKMLVLVSWIAIVILSIGYWLQIYKIHVHKEVRDLSLTYHILLAVGFAVLAVTAIMEDSIIFFVKQVSTTIPVMVIIYQILYHRKDRWYDPSLPFCATCKNPTEEAWTFCPFCGTGKKSKSLPKMDKEIT